MDLPKCRTCGEKHRLGGCPSHASKSRGGRTSEIPKLLDIASKPPPASDRRERSPRDTSSDGGVEGHVTTPSRIADGEGMRAAMEAMREPTDAMVEQGDVWADGLGYSIKVIEAMIDEAFK